MKFSVLAAFGAAIFCGLSFAGCGQNTSTADGSSGAPTSELDAMINSHEKVTNEYVRVAKKLKSGDVSLTVRYIELEKATREGSVKLQHEAPRMTPRQAQRVAGISAKAAPYLQP